jgi:hypothetical protein
MPRYPCEDVQVHVCHVYVCVCVCVRCVHEMQLPTAVFVLGERGAPLGDISTSVWHCEVDTGFEAHRAPRVCVTAY